MKRSATALALSASFLLPSVAHSAEIGVLEDVLPAGRVTLGVYDPQKAFAQDGNVAIEHIFVFWQTLKADELQKQLQNAEIRGRTMMVTVEPYTHAANWRDGGDRLFADIVAGNYRLEIERLCKELGRAKGRVLVRWGHEMEDPTGRYPWARQDATGYKIAFRSFVDSCRQLAPNTAFVWSPKGEKNLARYYPGDAHVDYIGLSLWGLEKMDRDFFGKGRTFAATFAEKYDLVAGFSKPVIIAELGVSGGKAYRDQWFSSLYRELFSTTNFAKLRAVVYFNDREPHHWPMGYGSPDWRISASWFLRAKHFAQEFGVARF